MTDQERAAMQQALECLKGVARGKYDGNAAEVCAALEAALAQQPEPVEPVAWLYTGIKQDGTEHGPHLVWKPEYMDAMSASKGAKATPLYFAPPRQAEPVEPVAWYDGKRFYGTTEAASMDMADMRALRPVYTAPPQQAEPVEPHRWEGDHNIESPFNACMHKSYCMTLKQAREPVASRGWLFRRNADGTIGIFAPPPKPGESQRTSDCVGPNNRDLHELLGKLADHMAALAQQAEPAQEPVGAARLFTLAHLWAQQCYLKGLGRPCDIDSARGAFEQALKAYTAPPQRKPLTEEEIVRVRISLPHFVPSPDQHPYEWAIRYARAVERAHNITDPQVEDRLARHGIPMPGDPK